MALKLYSTREQGYFRINWWLTDHCNWDCSYCHPELKSGQLPFPSIRDVKDFLDLAYLHAQKQGLRLDIDLTGGEVTLWTGLAEMLSYAKTMNARTKIRTNASASIEDLKTLFPFLDSIQIDYHPEYTRTSHFLLALRAAANFDTLDVSVVFNALPSKWSEIQELEQKVKDRWPRFNVTLRMLFDDPVRNSQIKDYTEEQKETIKRQHGDLILEDSGEQEFTDYQTLVLENKNVFKDWSCNIGLEQVVVDAWGMIRRGHCRQNGQLGKLGDEINFDSQPVLCQRNRCANAFDILATKTKSV